MRGCNLWLSCLALFLQPSAVLAQDDGSPDLVDRMNAVLRAVQPEGENAWPLYERILTEGIGQSWESAKVESGAWREFTTSRWYLADLGAWDDPRHDVRRQALERWGLVVPMLDAAAAAPGFARAYTRDARKAGPIIAPLTDLDSPMRELARFNAGAMRAAAERADWSACAQRLRVGLAMARHQSMQPTSGAQLMAVSILDMHLDEIRRQCNEKAVDAADARTLLAVCDEASWRAGAGFVPELEVRLHLIDARSEEVAALFDSEPWTDAEAALAEERLRTHLERMRDMAPRALRRYAQSNDVDDPDALFDPATAPEASLQLLYTAYRNTLSITSHFAATRLMLLLEVHHAETGAWPESLDAVGQPLDRIDPALGAPFRYRRTPDADHGFPYEIHLPAEAPDDWLRNGDGWLNPPRRALPEE